MMKKSKAELLKKVYQKLCECQDLAEVAGELELMYDFEDMRNKVDYIRFSK